MLHNYYLIVIKRWKTYSVIDISVQIHVDPTKYIKNTMKDMDTKQRYELEFIVLNRDHQNNLYCSFKCDSAEVN